MASTKREKIKSLHICTRSEQFRCWDWSVAIFWKSGDNFRAGIAPGSKFHFQLLMSATGFFLPSHHHNYNSALFSLETALFCFKLCKCFALTLPP